MTLSSQAFQNLTSRHANSSVQGFSTHFHHFENIFDTFLLQHKSKDNLALPHPILVFPPPLTVWGPGQGSPSTSVWLRSGDVRLY
jgi:hypothetical protein